MYNNLEQLIRYHQDVRKEAFIAKADGNDRMYQRYKGQEEGIRTAMKILGINPEENAPGEEEEKQ